MRPVGERVELTPPGEVARAALNRAKAAAVARGLAARAGAAPAHPARPAARVTRADARDPRLVADTLAALVRDRGWTEDVSVGGVVGRWRDVVGDQVADHCEPETFEDGVLTVRTDSTSWATNLKLLVPQLLRRLADDVGEDVVREVQVLGPGRTGVQAGSAVGAGRGPRDTWG